MYLYGTKLADFYLSKKDSAPYKKPLAYTTGKTYVVPPEAKIPASEFAVGVNGELEAADKFSSLLALGGVPVICGCCGGVAMFRPASGPAVPEPELVHIYRYS